MVKNLLLLIAMVVVLFSCESESLEESVNITEDIPQENPEIEPEKIIDTYIENDGGLNN